MTVVGIVVVCCIHTRPCPSVDKNTEPDAPVVALMKLDKLESHATIVVFGPFVRDLHTFPEPSIDKLNFTFEPELETTKRVQLISHAI